MNQGTPEWLAARAGHITASRFADVMAKGKTGEAQVRIKYRWELVTERLTGVAVESYTNKAMEWGTDHEAFARMAYEAQTENVVEEIGFVAHATVPLVGCSPDGLIGSDGGIEIKCPYNSVVHVQTLAGGMPPEHRAQVQGCMWVTDRQWWDFVSYDPRLPEKLCLYVERVKRDDDYIAKLAAEISQFQAEIERQHQALLQMAA